MLQVHDINPRLMGEDMLGLHIGEDGRIFADKETGRWAVSVDSGTARAEFPGHLRDILRKDGFEPEHYIGIYEHASVRKEALTRTLASLRRRQHNYDALSAFEEGVL